MVIQHMESPVPPTMAKEVLYIGSAVPMETSSGLEALQQPLRSRYPVNDEDIQGIPSVLTVLSGGLQLKYMEDPSHVVFFPYSALNLCAAVRCVNTTNTATSEVVNRFVSLTEAPNSDRPAIFATITRRTQGRHVLECSGFLTKNPTDALELVQWTSDADKRSKMNGGFVSMGGASTSFTATSSAHDVSKPDTSFHTEMSSPPDTPVNIVAGNSVGQIGKPGNYTELPKSGYFYTTQNANVKKFSLHKFTYQPGPPKPQPAAAQPIPIQIQPAHPVIESIPAPAPKIVETTEEHQHDRSSAYINGDHFDRRSIHSVPLMNRTPRLVAVRGPPPPRPMAPMMMGPHPILVPRPGPPPVQPVLVRGPPPGVMGVRPAFYPAFPPGVGRARPVPVMMPYPMAYPTNATLPKEKIHRRSSSSESSSSSTSSTSREGRGRRHHHHNNHQIVRQDHSFDSRPETPPTDYDLPPPRRHSRRDQFQMRQANGYAGGAMTLMPTRGGGGMPPGFVMLPMQSNGAIYGAPTLPRSKSVPAHLDKKSKKSKKNKKKNKKDKKKNYDQSYIGDFSHESDYYGYNSDIGPPNGHFGKSTSRPLGESFMGATGRTNNLFGESRMSSRNLGSSQFVADRGFSKNAAERAFSSSLAAETRKSTRGSNVYNAYSLNQNEVGEAEFPAMR